MHVSDPLSAIFTARCVYLLLLLLPTEQCISYLFSWAAASFLHPLLQLWHKVKDLAASALVQSFMVTLGPWGVSSRVMGCPLGSFFSCTRNIYLKLTSLSFQQDVSYVGVMQYEVHLVIEASLLTALERKRLTRLSTGQQWRERRQTHVLSVVCVTE